MHRYCRAPAIGVAELFVRTALADFYETERLQQGDDFSGFEDWYAAHRLGNIHRLDTDKLDFQLRGAILR